MDLIGYLYTHPIIIFFAVFLILGVVAYYIIKSLSSKATPKKQEVPKEKVEKTEGQDDIKAQTEEKKTEKKDKKPSVVRVYEPQKDDGTSQKSQTESLDDDREVEFVKTSANVSKFKSFKNKSKETEKNESNVDEFGFVQEKQDDCELCETGVKHFDHSRRLSKIIKDDSFDDMFASHISDGYMNINVDRHLSVGEDFEQSLYSRASKTLSNSDSKVLIDPSDDNFEVKNDRDYMKSWLEDRRRSEYANTLSSEDEDENSDINVSEKTRLVDAKTLLVSDAVFKRKKWHKK